MIISMILPLISVLAVSDPNYVFQLCFGLVVLGTQKDNCFVFKSCHWAAAAGFLMDWGELSYVTL
jgi:hypothetical protein